MVNRTGMPCHFCKSTDYSGGLYFRVDGVEVRCCHIQKCKKQYTLLHNAARYNEIQILKARRQCPFYDMRSFEFCEKPKVDKDNFCLTHLKARCFACGLQATHACSRRDCEKVCCDIHVHVHIG